jgi:hypothetical protein
MMVSVLEVKENNSIEDSLCGEYKLDKESVARLTLFENNTYLYRLGSAINVKGTWELKGSNLSLQMQSRTLEATVVYDKIIGSPDSFIIKGIWEKVSQE